MNKKMTWLDNPIFICGHQRSGTTLVLSLLDGHPSLMVLPEEIQLFTQVYPFRNPKQAFLKRFRGILHSAKTGQPLQGKKGIRHYAHLDPTILESQLEQRITQANTWPELLKAGAQAYFEANPNLRNHDSELKFWVEKTPSQELFAPTLSRWFKGIATFIYILRDPRDVFISYRTLHTDLTVRALARRWERSIITAWLLRHTNSKFYILKYESLVKNPEREMAKLLAKLNLKPEPVCSTPTLSGNIWASKKNFEGVSVVPAGGYLHLLKPDELVELERLLFIPMRLAGYRCITRKAPTVGAVIRFIKLAIQAIIAKQQRLSIQTPHKG